jgi:hypothetical protein
MIWREENAPVSEPAEDYALGRALIENQLNAELGASGSFQTGPGRLEARIDIPLSTGLVSTAPVDEI